MKEYLKYETKRDEFVEYDRSYVIGETFLQGELDCARQFPIFVIRYFCHRYFWTFTGYIGIRKRHEDFNNPNSQPDFIYCMTGRFFCCGDDIGLVANFRSANTLCNHQGSRLYTVKSGNITNDVLNKLNIIEQVEFFWTDKGSHMAYIIAFNLYQTRTNMLVVLVWTVHNVR